MFVHKNTDCTMRKKMEDKKFFFFFGLSSREDATSGVWKFAQSNAVATINSSARRAERVKERRLHDQSANRVCSSNDARGCRRHFYYFNTRAASFTTLDALGIRRINEDRYTHCARRLSRIISSPRAYHTAARILQTLNCDQSLPRSTARTGRESSNFDDK